jgi:O-antigen/teichoic acid export membrane protein
VLQFISLPIITHYITPNDFGIIALSQLFATITFSVCNLGLPVAYERNYFVAEKSNLSSQLLHTIQIIVLLLVLIVGFFLWIFKNKISYLILDNPHLGVYIFLTFLATSISGLKNYFLIYFKNSYNSKMYAWVSIDETILSVFFLIFFLVYFKLGIYAIIYGQLLSGLIVFLFLIIKFSRKEKIKFDFSLIIDSLKISLPLVPKIFLSILERSSDKIILGYINSVSGVGLLGFANKFSNLNFTFLTSLENMFLPKIYELMFNSSNEEEGGKLIGEMLMPYIFLSVCFSVVISFFSFEFIYIFSDSKFYEAANFISIIILLTSTYFFGKIPQLVFKKKTKIISNLGVLTFILNFILGLPMAIYFGTYGVVFSSLCSGLISLFTYLYYSQKYYKIYYNWNGVLFIFGILYFGTILVLSLNNLPYSFLLLIKITLITILFLYGLKMNYIEFMLSLIKDKNSKK